MSTDLKSFLFLLMACILFGSCASYKYVPYFQDLPKEVKTKLDTIQNYNLVTLQPNDLLDLKVKSMDTKANAIFNRPGALITTTFQTADGFLVDQQGFIQIPIIGSVKVGGLTTPQAKELILQKLEQQIKMPVVSGLRIINFNISVFGDVNHPGIYPVASERVTILEALTRAGDLRPNALRNNILLIREIEGKRQFIRLDIESKEIFDSPYFYLRNNDLVYVQPGSRKEKRDIFLMLPK